MVHLKKLVRQGYSANCDKVLTRKLILAAHILINAWTRIQTNTFHLRVMSIHVHQITTYPR